MPQLNEWYRAKWTQATREAYYKESPENFAGPDQSFPIRDGSDVDYAYRLAGHAADPDAVRAKIKAIAKRLGLTSSLPDTAKDETPKEERVAMSTALNRAATHDPMSGKHSHTHPAFGSQGDDDMHEHEHTHDNDADHHHMHSEARMAASGLTPDHFAVYLPITRVDTTSRTVTGQATVEKPDSYGTIFGYYPEAWLTWRGNMREQHDPKKAVGKAIEVIPDPEERAIYVTSKVSRGAQDTWLKIEDGVLSGYSASIIPDPEFGNDISRWPKKEYGGKLYPYLPRYTVAETSYVDNPATPGCNISLVRADGFLTEIIDASEDEVSAPPQVIERAGARVSSDTKGKMHQSIAHTLHAAVSQMQNCGCDSCMQAQKMIDPDGDGDIDIGSFDDPDQDADDLYNGRDGDLARQITAMIERIVTAQIGAVYSRLQSIAGTLARSNANLSPAFEQVMTSSLTRALETIDAKLATLSTKSSLDEVRADLSAVKDQVGKIADTPLPGAPFGNLGALPRPVQKHLPTDPALTQPQRSGSAVLDAIAQLSEQGKLDTPDKQADAVWAGLLAQQGRI